MFKFKKVSKFEVKIGDIYTIHGIAYQITAISGDKQPIVFGVSVNGGKQEALFYVHSLGSENFKKSIKKVI